MDPQITDRATIIRLRCLQAAVAIAQHRTGFSDSWLVISIAKDFEKYVVGEGGTQDEQ